MEELNNVPSSGTYGAAINEVNANFALIVNAINSLEYQTTRSKGILNYGTNPATAFPNAVKGDWCMILSEGNVFPATIKTFNGSTWSGSSTWNPEGLDLTGYATKDEMTAAITKAISEVKIETVDNLDEETAASGKALDAHQGFVLAGQIDNLTEGLDEVNAELNATEVSIFGKENIDYSTVTPIMKAIGTTDGQLVWKSPISYYCYVFPFSSKRHKKVKFTANANYVTNIAFLVADGDVGSPVSFAGTAGVKIIPVNEEAMYSVPSGTNYLYVLYSQGAGKICFPAESLAYYEKDYLTDEDLDFHFDESEYPFDIMDENNKKIVIFENGHIRTKKFNSAQGHGDYSASTVRFTVSVNVNMLRDTADSASVQDSKASTYYDNGILMLPESYTPDGKPTRLVIHCHGAGGGASDHDSQTESLMSAKYLVANGYAVMDMNGMPNSWVETWDDDFTPADKRQYIKVNNLGCPLAMECYIKGYQWVIEHYNIAKDGVMLEGGSMGGLSSTNLALSYRIPVLAHALAAPVLDLYNQAFVHPWTNGASKFAMCNLYNFEKENDVFVYDVAKVKGYNPIVNGMQTYVDGARRSSEGSYDFMAGTLDGDTITEYKSYPCPLKIWHCDNDPTVNIACSMRQVTAVKNAGGMAWLRRFPSGGHAPDTAGTIVSNPSGNLDYKGTTLTNIYPFAEELLLFFNRFNNG